MNSEAEFVSFQKVLVFGIKSSGKTTLTKYILSGKFNEEEPTGDSILQLFILFFLINLLNRFFLY